MHKSKTIAFIVIILLGLSLQSWSQQTEKKEDLTERVQYVINAWKPVQLKNENQYRDALYSVLKEKLKGPVVPIIQTEYCLRRLSIDIVIDDSIAIEMKYNMHYAKERTRAIGQVAQYLTKFPHVFLVMCGQTRNADSVEIRRQYLSDKRVFPIFK